MGLSDVEFWGLTLAQFDALAERYQDNQQRLDFRSALICAVIANVNRSKESKIFTPSDFMAQSKADDSNQTSDAMLQRLIQVTVASGGKTVELNKEQPCQVK